MHASDLLYEQYVTEAGYAHPTSAAELQSIIIASGISVELRADAPGDFVGVQINSTIFVNGRMHEHQIVKVLAHEWCHALRANGRKVPVRLYEGVDQDGREDEEAIARSFERRFRLG